MPDHKLPACLVLALVILVSGCAENPVWVQHPGLGKPMYLRVAMRPEGQNLLPSSYLTLSPTLKPGTAAKVDNFSAVRIDLVVDKIPYKMYPTDARFDVGKIAVFLDRYFVKDTKELGFDKLEKTLQANILNGVAIPSMTKEQVLMALGYPALIDSKIDSTNIPRDRVLKSDIWYYRNHIVVFAPIWHVYHFQEGALKSIQK